MEDHMYVVDVITTVADGITTFGRCNNHIAGGTPNKTANVLVFIFVTDRITTMF